MKRSLLVMAVIFSATAAAAQSVIVDPTDIFMRAGYCMGLLDKVTAQLQRETTATDQKMQALEAGMMQALIGHYRARRQRYAQYMLLRLPGMSNDQLLAIAGSAAKGKQDAALLNSAANDPNVMRCLQARYTDPDGHLGCIGRINQTYVSIFRCTQGPDGLPF